MITTFFKMALKQTFLITTFSESQIVYQKDYLKSEKKTM